MPHHGDGGVHWPDGQGVHAYQYKRTARTETLFARPGTAYLYLIYGMYHCLNVVTEAEGEPCAVLIRGAVPVENKDIIAENRFGRKEKELTAAQRRNFLNGPASCAGGWPSPGRRTVWICWSRLSASAQDRDPRRS